jgi:hypothetical protein
VTPFATEIRQSQSIRQRMDNNENAKGQTKAKRMRLETPHPLNAYTLDEIMTLEYRLLENKVDYVTVQRLVQVYTVEVC